MLLNFKVAPTGLLHGPKDPGHPLLLKVRYFKSLMMLRLQQQRPNKIRCLGLQVSCLAGGWGYGGGSDWVGVGCCWYCQLGARSPGIGQAGWQTELLDAWPDELDNTRAPTNPSYLFVHMVETWNVDALSLAPS